MSVHINHKASASSSTKSIAPACSLFALMACTALGGLSSSSITAAAPVLAEHMRTPWLVPSYFVGAGLAAVAGGRVADLLGPRRVAAGGLLVVVLASVLASAAPTGTALSATRFLLGAAVATLFPCAVVLVRRLRPTASAQLAGLAAISLATEVTFAAGPSLGSVLVGLGGWRLLVLAPGVLAVPAGVLLLLAVPADHAPSRPRELVHRLDPLGLLLLGTVAGATLAALQTTGNAACIIVLSGAAVALTILITWERRASYALFPPAVMTAPLRAVYARTIAYYAALYALVLAMPVWLVETRHLTAGQTALVMTGLPLVTVLSCVATPAVIKRRGLRLPLVLGALALVSAATVLITAERQTPLLVLAAAVALCGIPAGLVNIAQQAALLHATPAGRTGACSGLYGVVQLLTGAATALVPTLGTAAVVALAGGGALIALTVTDHSLRPTARTTS